MDVFRLGERLMERVFLVALAIGRAGAEEAAEAVAHGIEH
jgi:hypothetical protein